MSSWSPGIGHRDSRRGRKQRWGLGVEYTSEDAEGSHVALEITVQRSTQRKARPSEEELGFGKFFTDHMFRIDYDPAQGGWHAARIVPYAPIPLDPATSALHYGQLFFEGVKGFAAPDGGVRLFRPDAFARRLNASARRLCMPELDPALLVEAIRRLVDVDRDWVPRAPGTSVYVRPFMLATEAFLGVRPSRTYSLLVILSPVGAYFSRGGGLRIRVETETVRAVRGGLGAAKAAANYVASLLAAEQAKAEGYDQVLWLDGVEQHWADEIGTMNFFARVGDRVITPPLDGTILAGVTRDSALRILRDAGTPVEERRLSIEELERAHAEGTLSELFGTGTAAVVSPIAELVVGGRTLVPREGAPGPLARRLREEITAIQVGQSPDRYDWMVQV
jgi:branched-chain amino acid aminotransferase